MSKLKKNHIVTKHKNSNGNQTQLKLGQNSKTQIVTELKTHTGTKLKTQIVTKQTSWANEQY